MKFNEIINQNKPVLVDFYADWCGPCQTMTPILQDLKKKMGDKAGVIKINVDKNPQAAAAFKVRSIPTLILFKNGRPLWRQAGVVPSRELENIIGKYV